MRHPISAEAFAECSPSITAELYNALYTMTEVYWGVDDDKNGDGGEPPPDCIVKARAALAKAVPERAQ